MIEWENYQKKYPVLSKWLYQIAYFWVFSMGVTVFQYLFFTFVPYLLGEKLAAIEFMWPQIPIHFGDFSYKWNLLGYEVVKNAQGQVLIGGGLGYFISYQLGSFLAQCINFPLQRNITFKSKGNIKFQILGYLIAWILISLFCNGINGLWLPIAQASFSPAVYNILVTYITGTISMIIYFFAYKIIFPEGSKKR